MSLKLLVDECLLDKSLVALLREAGHDVLTATESGLIAKRDEVVFEAAIAQGRLFITLNCHDFITLHERKVAEAGSAHPGILLVFRVNRPGKELSNDDIVKAIANLESTGTALENNYHSLNNYNYRRTKKSQLPQVNFIPED